MEVKGKANQTKGKLNNLKLIKDRQISFNLCQKKRRQKIAMVA